MCNCVNIADIKDPAVIHQENCKQCIKAILPRDFYMCGKCGVKRQIDYYIEVCDEHLLV